MTSTWEKIATGILAASAVAMAVTVVHAAYFTPAPGERPPEPPEYIDDWESALAVSTPRRAPA